MVYNFFINNLLVSLSRLSTKSSSFIIVTLSEIHFNKVLLRQFMSIGSLTTSLRLSTTKLVHSSTKQSIYKKSLLINIEMTFLISSLGNKSYDYGCTIDTSLSFFMFKYLINHSNILISQWTLISISSADVASVKYFSKYFI